MSKPQHPKDTPSDHLTSDNSYYDSTNNPTHAEEWPKDMEKVDELVAAVSMEMEKELEGEKGERKEGEKTACKIAGEIAQAMKDAEAKEKDGKADSSS